ncbi:tyrosine recombinase XerC [Actinoplanes sp. SE50]|uniref:tyrosine-type recombinase/integrase n=1 Tax=unclassified Actinoplanes TaxID=2626549 RepID=UPI00023EBC85|nr:MULTISPECIES: site-specific integrase [unclassified Actinoplanes]AEV81237.1 Tyrosine recombinase xerC [Actinoplanes sp. SE50/110]ATO79640.1 tyrosine recombinase XerC [Actinoplanes sp. SE50]SLL97043.1 site-specific tyrosine recombinase XerC [Actinoplanes sp. SE50/110]
MSCNEVEGVFRRCGCKDTVTGRRFDGRCPRLADPKHGSWYFSVQLPDEQSRPTRFRRGGFRTARQAQAVRNQTVASAAAGAGLRRVTVEQWLRRWLLSLPGQVRRSTAAGYSIHVRRYLIPHLGHHTLTGLRAAHIEAMFTTITAQPSRTGAPLSAATLQKIRATLRRALNMAIREQLLAINPARLVLLPRPRRHRPQPWSASRVAAWQDDGHKPVVAVWTPQQLAEFLLFVRDDPLFALWWLAALRGLRRGEICALRWTDVDLAEGTLTVSHTIAHANGRPYWDTPKTAAGQRTVALDRMTVAVLLRSQRQQRRRRAECAGERWQPNGPVFTRQGRAIRPDWLTHRFATLVDASKLPPIRLHCLRHGAATLALAAHVDLKTVQDMLGHTSYAFTADTYATVLPDQAKHAAESTARLVLDALNEARPAVGARLGPGLATASS